MDVGSLLFLRRFLNNGNQFRRRHFSNSVIFGRASNHALAAFYAELLVNTLFAISGSEYSVNRTTGSAGVTAPGT
jgi:hypothetical protein